MNSFIKSMSNRSKNVLFGTLYAILACFAVLPPLYLWGSGSTTLFLGAPLSMWYWIVNFVLLVVLMFTLYHVETIRGEAGEASETVEKR